MTQTAVITGGTGGMGIATAKILGTDHRINDLRMRQIGLYHFLTPEENSLTGTEVTTLESR